MRGPGLEPGLPREQDPKSCGADHQVTTNKDVTETCDDCGVVSGVVRAGKQALEDPELTRVLDAWPTLPEHIKRAIIALIDSAMTEEK